MASLIILLVVFFVFLYIGLRPLSTPEGREDFRQGVKDEVANQKIRKCEKKRQKEQAWREIGQDWMMSDVWWNSSKNK